MLRGGRIGCLRLRIRDPVVSQTLKTRPVAPPTKAPCNMHTFLHLWLPATCILFCIYGSLQYAYFSASIATCILFCIYGYLQHAYFSASMAPCNQWRSNGRFSRFNEPGPPTVRGPRPTVSLIRQAVNTCHSCKTQVQRDRYIDKKITRRN